MQVIQQLNSDAMSNLNDNSFILLK